MATLSMVVPIFPAFAQAVPAQDALITLPAGEELSDIALSLKSKENKRVQC